MVKRNLLIVYIVFMAIIVVFAVKIINIRGDEGEKRDASMSLQEQYTLISKSSKPSIIVFSYDGECCESTKKFFDEYNNKAKQVMKDYESKYETLFINTESIKEKNDSNVLNEIVEEYGVSKVPSLLIRDNENRKVRIFEGVFDHKEVRKVLDEVIKK